MKVPSIVLLLNALTAAWAIPFPFAQTADTSPALHSELHPELNPELSAAVAPAINTLCAKETGKTPPSSQRGSTVANLA